MALDERLIDYEHISKGLASLSDQHLKNLLEKATFNYSGMGSASAYLTIDKINIFVKKIPLTGLERIDKNVMSTVNFFNLPLYYQYGIGSAGFGAWRELAAHIMTTNWVRKGECLSFPLMYHWRILETTSPAPMNAEQAEKLEKDFRYWDSSPAVRERLEQIHNSSAHILLFHEYIPHTLYQWLGSPLAADKTNEESTISFVERELTKINKFLKSQNFIHFDAHFENILTDGKSLYLSDFGLSLSLTFDLSSAEIEFFKNHIIYDQCCMAVNLLHCIIVNTSGKDKWPLLIQESFKNGDNFLSKHLNSIIKRCGKIALVMDEFYKRLQKMDKHSLFPREHLEDLLAVLG